MTAFLEVCQEACCSVKSCKKTKKWERTRRGLQRRVKTVKGRFFVFLWVMVARQRTTLRLWSLDGIVEEHHIHMLVFGLALCWSSWVLLFFLFIFHLEQFVVTAAASLQPPIFTAHCASILSPNNHTDQRKVRGVVLCGSCQYFTSSGHFRTHFLWFLDR